MSALEAAATRMHARMEAAPGWHPALLGGLALFIACWCAAMILAGFAVLS